MKKGCLRGWASTRERTEIPDPKKGGIYAERRDPSRSVYSHLARLLFGSTNLCYLDFGEGVEGRTGLFRLLCQDFSFFPFLKPVGWQTCGCLPNRAIRLFIYVHRLRPLPMANLQGIGLNFRLKLDFFSGMVSGTVFCILPGTSK